jgi:hypothetical protein
MTPEESDARLRRIHEEWRRWCAAHPTGGFREADTGSRDKPATVLPEQGDEATP